MLRQVDCAAPRPDGKVPLQKCWTFWFFQPSNNADAYDKQLQKLDEFDTVQDFWACHNALPLVDQLQHKHCFHLMKKGVKPEWEDEANRNGGTWTLKVEKANAQDVWQKLMLAVIGEQFTAVLPKSDEICGITVKGGINNQFIFQLWHRDEEHKQAVHEKLMELLQAADAGELKGIFYKSHSDELSKTAK